MTGVELNMAVTTERSVRVVISKDKTQASLSLQGVHPDIVSVESILSAIKEIGLIVAPELEARVKQIVQQFREKSLSDEPIVIAQGRHPIEGTAATFELTAGAPPPEEVAQSEDSAAKTDFYRSQILTVQAGDPLGVLTPEIPHQPGLDVFNKPIEPARGLMSIKLGDNVKLDQDGTTVVATAPGKLHLNRYTVSVVEVVEIEGDVDFNSGNVDAPSDVLVDGTVREGFQVRSPKSVTIRGAIEAAEVEAGSDLQVNGGIMAQSKGHVVAGGEIFTKFCNEANLRAGGDLTITREAMNSHIHCGGQLRIAHGGLIGGMAFARQGGELHELGNTKEIKTQIAIGVDPRILAEARESEAKLKKRCDASQKIRESVAPLMAQLKRLTPEQREKATELMFQADTIDMEVEEERQRIKDKIASGSPEQPAVLTVVKELHPGVSIICGDKIAHFNKPRKGPIRIMRRLEGRCEEIVMIDKISGSVTILAAREYEPESV